jgi:glycosyltransferase involved in cell wall biosynthesis
VLRVPRPPQGPLLRRGFEPYLTHVPLSYAVLRGRPAGYRLAHAVYPADALAASRWRRVTGRPALLSYLGIPDRAGLRFARLRLETLQAAIAGVDAVTALSRYAAEGFERWLGVQARVIAPGVDLDAFRPGPLRSQVPTVLCGADAGEPRKQVRLLIEAVGLLRREIPELRLILSQPRSMAAVAAAGIDPQTPGIEWRNLDARPALADAYREAWVSVLPSRAEAFGLVIAESLACGTPVVGLRDGAIPELIDSPQIGRLFDESAPVVLAGALEDALTLARTPGVPDACRAQAERFGVDVCTARYLDLYAELIDAR